MKKRTIISIIFSLICVFATNKLWLNFVPMSVKLNIAGEGNVKITAYLDKKENNEFKKSKKASTEVELNQYGEEIILEVKRAKAPKRLKISVLGAGGGKTLAISEIQLCDDKLDLSNKKSITVIGGDLKIEDGLLYITPKNDKVDLIYNKILNVRSSIKFEFLTLISLVVLSFLLFYKLTSYLADFKNIQHQSRLEIIFLAIFFTILFVPMINIDKDSEKSKAENRMLAKWNNLITEDGIFNYNFGKNFNEWYNDRFYLRTPFIKLYNNIQYYISVNFYETQKAYLDKRTNWAFNSFVLSEKFSSHKIDNIKSFLNNINVFCKNNNIKLYVLVVPKKDDIYSKETIFKTEIADLYSNQILEISKDIGVPIVYPYQDLKNASKKDFVYFKSDHHWTDTGAFLGNNALISAVQKDFPKIKQTLKSDFKYSKNKLVRVDFGRTFFEGQAYSQHLMLPKSESKKFLDVDYTYFEHKDNKNLKCRVTTIFKMKKKEFEYKNGANLKTVLIGTSMSENLLEFLPYSFKNTIYYRINGVEGIPKTKEFNLLERFGENLKNDKPDILILCLTLANLNMLPDKIKEK